MAPSVTPFTTEQRGPLAGWPAVFRAVYHDLQQDDVTLLAAALAYHAIFSIAPVLLIVTAIVGAVYGEEAANGQLRTQLVSALGAPGAEFVEGLVARSRRGSANLMAALVGIGTVLYAATGVFTQLRKSFNIIWRFPNGGLHDTLRSRLVAVLMVASIGLLLIASLTITTAIAAADRWIETPVPLRRLALTWINAGVSLGITAALFALLFRYLPAHRIPWREALAGALLTAVLFGIGKWAFSLYLTHGAVGSSYGAAGAIIILLLWVYYSSLVVFLGVEFMQAYSRAFGSHSDR
jgi:membrane protein